MIEQVFEMREIVECPVHRHLDQVRIASKFERSLEGRTINPDRIDAFRIWLTVDKRLSSRCAREYVRKIENFPSSANAQTSEDLTTEVFRKCKSQHIKEQPNTYANRFKALRLLRISCQFESNGIFCISEHSIQAHRSSKQTPSESTLQRAIRPVIQCDISCVGIQWVTTARSDSIAEAKCRFPYPHDRAKCRRISALNDGKCFAFIL